MNVNVDELVVENNESAEQFEVQVEGMLALAAYKLAPDMIIFTHTEVPKPLSGHGIADKIVHTALEYARKEQLAVVPFCPFVAAYIRRHTGYKGLVHSEYQHLVS
jgi:predicted GNAT family acetyltransferase